MRALNSILVTGGAGFIGSNFMHYLFNGAGFDGRIVNVDALTYAGNLDNTKCLQDEFGGSRYFFEQADICDRALMADLFRTYEIDTVVHFAAESHVDRSILGPEAFVKTNVLGTFTLLEVARSAWKGREDVLFHHVSTDEVYGSLGSSGSFLESTPYDPRSPYSASKAASDHLVRAYNHTYGLPITLSNCSNNYGPYQFPEKLIPLMILNMLEAKPLPVYGDGKNVRDWLYVADHAAAVWLIVREAESGESFNIGGESEWENIRLLEKLIEIVAEKTKMKAHELRGLISYVKDRPGHDRRYSINCGKLKRRLGWKQNFTFEQGLDLTVDWYLNNQPWIDNVRSGAYQRWTEVNYGSRQTREIG
jgi:dTDP-glucose 4,6-dehydratase